MARDFLIPVFVKVIKYSLSLSVSISGDINFTLRAEQFFLRRWIEPRGEAARSEGLLEIRYFKINASYFPGSQPFRGFMERHKPQIYFPYSPRLVGSPRGDAITIPIRELDFPILLSENFQNRC